MLHWGKAIGKEVVASSGQRGGRRAMEFQNLDQQRKEGTVLSLCPSARVFSASAPPYGCKGKAECEPSALLFGGPALPFRSASRDPQVTRFKNSLSEW